MFVLTTISDLIQIAPRDFRKSSADAIEDNIGLKYSNRVIQNVGLCICFWDLLKASEGLISQGNGMVNVNVGCDFFSDVWIPAPNLFENSAYLFREDDHVWIWTTEDGAEFFYDKNEVVRFRVEDEVWHDHTPQKPNPDVDESQEVVDKAVPYTIIASMQQSGLGPIVWWQDEEDAGPDAADATSQ